MKILKKLQFFSLTSSRWSKERNRLSFIESVKGIVTSQFNFKSLSSLDSKYLLKTNDKKNSSKYMKFK